MTDEANQGPTRRFVECAISSGADGFTRRYLLEAARLQRSTNEKRLRNECAELRMRARESAARELACQTLRSINGFYNTRLALDHIPHLSDILFNAVERAGWWRSEPPRVLDRGNPDTEAMGAFVVKTLGEVSSAGLPRAYSLFTKWLHFCFPDSFGICDARAASSIQTWSYFTFRDDDARGQGFLTAETLKTDGSGYKEVLDFYRFCRQHSSDEQHRRLCCVADELSDLIGARVAPIDVLDKLLWHASGDPRKLGLLKAQATQQSG